MRITQLLLTLFTGLLITHTGIQAQSYRALLTGRGEVPPVLTAAYGEVSAELVGDTLTLSGYFRDLTGELAVNVAGGSHIHSNYAGRNGGIAHALKISVDSTLHNGTWDADSNRVVLTPEQKEALAERALYVNVHSSVSPGGEIRGQLMPLADAYYATNLAGSYENPAVLSRGRGALVLDLQADTLTISGTFNALGSPWNGGMHLHLGAAGQNGPVSIPIVAIADSTALNGVARAADNRVTLTPEQKAALAERRMYANVHSMSFGGGELRGQVTSVALAVFRGHLSGMNEIPFVPSRAGGMVIAELGADSTITVSGSFVGIASRVATDVGGGAHIHLGVAGRNGGIQFPLNSDLNPDSTGGVFAADSNTFKLNAALHTSLFGRSLYANVHSNTVRSGEIRGQLLPESQMVFNANLSSVARIPAARGPAAGLIKAELNGNQLTLTGSFSGLTSDVDTSSGRIAHLHLAPTGATGLAIGQLNLRFDAGNLTQAILGPNTFMLTDERVTALLARGIAIDVHALRAASEIRAQLLPEAPTYFFASLAGGNESNPVKSGAVGQLILEYQRNGATTASGSFHDLQGELATNIAGGVHIHGGWNGQNGPVLIPIATEAAPDLHSGVFVPSQNTFQLSAGRQDTLFDMGLYVNVHSSFSPSGEIRGQLLPAATAHLNAVLRPMNEVQPITSAAHGSASAILSGNILRVTGSFADLAGDFAPNIAGGSHIHNARAGFNGGISVPLKTRVAGDLKSGIFRADTAYMLMPDQVQGVLNGSMYVNVHTTMHTGGELRGQILSSFNTFPNASSEITQPIPNTTVTVSSNSFETLLISWTASSDPTGTSDMDSLAYIVQVTPDPTFNLIPIQVNTANQREFNVLTLAYIDTLLANFGIPIGFPLSVNARVIASDGSLQSTGEVFSFTLLREPPSAVKELPAGWSFDVYPTLTQQEVNVEITAPNASDIGVTLISVNGEQKFVQEIERAGGDVYHTSLDLTSCAPGLWIVGLMDHGRLIGQQKILVVK
ncbi:MAG TPA: CHRD domain-containing protein [Saprospiraceae bacterium]|nr:CHRD domain-containing protein [Saprospiraceae bacterium]